MEEAMKKTALYPGCSLEGTAIAYLVSLQKVMGLLGLECHTLEGWSCCGATSAHAMDHRLYLAMAARNLALAESQGYEELLAPCAACYHRLASAHAELSRDEELCGAVNRNAGLNYSCSVKVRNALDLLANVAGAVQISRSVRRPLSRMKVACYYGCLNTRLPRSNAFDDVEYPMCMDRIVQALGAETLDWSYKTECCGASLFVTAEPVACALVSRILKEAEARGADFICVACPMCHNNLDTKQAQIRKAYALTRPIPILFVSQLMGLAFGLSESELRLADHFIPAKCIMELL